jgi:hypothetical protein
MLVDKISYYKPIFYKRNYHFIVHNKIVANNGTTNFNPNVNNQVQLIELYHTKIWLFKFSILHIIIKF